MKSIATPVLLLLALGLPVMAQDTPPPANTPPVASPAAGAEGSLEAPEVQPSPITGETVEPEVTIREGQRETIYEYRVRGRVYMVKVKPQIGPPYYLTDTNGDGTLDQRSNSPLNIDINQWILFTWD
jgi:hypothetical protein